MPFARTASGAARPTHHARSTRVRPAVRRPVSATPWRADGRAAAAPVVQARAAAGTVEVQFSINKQLQFGEELVLVGDHECLGGWQLEAAPRMTWSEGDDWRVALELPAGAQFEYKFVIAGLEFPIWEECPNRVWAAERHGAVLACSWDSTDVSVVGGSPHARDAPPLDVAPAFRPAQPMTPSFSGALARRGAVGAVNGAVAAASGATAAAEAVVAAAEAAAQAVERAVAAAEAVVAELSAAGNGAAKPVPGGAGAYSPEQLEFLRRKRSDSPNGAAAVVATRAAPHTVASAAEGVLAATTAAAEAAARVVAVAESVAAELTGALGAPAAGAPPPTGAPQRAAPAAPSASSLSPEQLAFMRRKLDATHAQPSRAGGSAAPSGGAAREPAAAAGFSPEQLEFLKRKGAVPQAAAAPRGAPAPQAAHQQYSPEQLEFMRRAGKL